MSLDDELIVKPLTVKFKAPEIDLEQIHRDNVIEMQDFIRKHIKRWMGTWPANCDICGNSLTSPNLYFIDGRTKDGPWALMCTQCHYMHGVGLGTGRGQKYDSKTLIKLEG